MRLEGDVKVGAKELCEQTFQMDLTLRQCTGRRIRLKMLFTFLTRTTPPSLDHEWNWPTPIMCAKLFPTTKHRPLTWS